mmetsp:Transcript_7597/g.12768  ORF Transcript_7597/g.12768 Transcript_7597/m.12768 type:complete len:224 (-) Transcript_7597:205-876(-)
MAFAYNSLLTFQWLEHTNNTMKVFGAWFNNMENVKKNQELRRNIFGLSAIIKTPEASLPPIVLQKLPDIMSQLSILTTKMHKDRMDTLKENEEYVKKGGVDDDSDAEGEGDEGFEDEVDEMGEDSEEEYKKHQKVFEKLGSKLHTGKALTQEEMNDAGLDIADYDDEDDEDYEFDGDNLDIYESRLDDIDEIKTLRDTLQEVASLNPSMYERLMGGLADQAKR